MTTARHRAASQPQVMSSGMGPELNFKGASSFAILLLKPAFERLGDEAEAGLRKAFNRLLPGRIRPPRRRHRHHSAL